jgi:acetyl-CoA carboxylase biotin carboxyl carrier protein
VITDGPIDVIAGDGPDGSGELLLKSPAVGLYGCAPLVGEVLVAGSRAGRLTVLGRTVELLVPRGVTGRVAETFVATRKDPVDYGQVVLRLVPVEASDEFVGVTAGARNASRNLPDGSFAVVSPTHGMFYRRPRPDEPAYVETGQIVENGSTLGLVEVMKSFSAIVYGGGELPPRAEVIEVRADDGAEVESDQVLFVVRPA